MLSQFTCAEGLKRYATGDVINAAEVLDLVAEHPHVVASRSNGTADVYTVADDGKLQLVFSLRGSESAVDSTLLSRGKTGEMLAKDMPTTVAYHIINAGL